MDDWNNFTNLELNEIVKSNNDQIDKAKHDYRSIYIGLKRGVYRPCEADHYRETLTLISKTLNHLGVLDSQVLMALQSRAAAFGPQLKGSFYDL